MDLLHGRSVSFVRLLLFCSMHWPQERDVETVSWVCCRPVEGDDEESGSVLAGLWPLLLNRSKEKKTLLRGRLRC